MKATKGFTLIELAVVIAIIAILAAVAIPRFADTTAQAELSTIKDFKASLASAAAMYTAAQSTSPNGFNNYVTNAQAVNNPFTMSTYGFGPKGATSPCTVAAATVTCNTTFNKWTVTYNWNSGSVTGKATPANGNSFATAAVNF